MGSIFNKVIQFFQEEGWHYELDKNRPIVNVVHIGKHGFYFCHVQARDEESLLVFCAVPPLYIPSHRRRLMAELLTRANYGLAVGNFEMDFSDGEVRFRTGIYVEDSDLTIAQIRRLVYNSLSTLDTYMPAIMRIGFFSDARPEQALAEIGREKKEGEEEEEENNG